MKLFNRLLSVVLGCLIALPVRAAPGEIKIPLTGGQVLFQMFKNPSGDIPSGVPPLDLRNVRSSTPFVSKMVGGMNVSWTQLSNQIEQEMDAAVPMQGEKIDLIGSQGDHDYCYMVFDLHPTITFLTQPQTLNITESTPGHLSASFEESVSANINVQANVFNIPVIGSRHLEADIFAVLLAKAKLTDVGVWPPDTTDLFNSGNPPTINTNHVELTIQQLMGNVTITGLAEPLALAGFVIGFGGVLAGPFTLGISTILAILGPIIAAAAPGIEDLVENILTQVLNMMITRGIGELDTILRDVVASAGNQINAANEISNRAPEIMETATALNSWMNGWFGASFGVDTRIDNDFVAAGLTLKRNPGATLGSNTVQGRVKFPKYKCEYEQGQLLDIVTSCDGHSVSKSYIYEMKAKLVPDNADLVGKSCASLFNTDGYSKSYLGSDWSPPNATPTWQTLPSPFTGTVAQQTSSGGKTFYTCDFNVTQVPSNLILDFGAKAGSSLATRMVPKRIGPSLPTELAIDASQYTGRVHMLVKPTFLPLTIRNEDGNAVTTRSEIGDPGPQPATLATDCPSYSLALDGYQAGYCTNPGNYESPCGDCY